MWREGDDYGDGQYDPYQYYSSNTYEQPADARQDFDMQYQQKSFIMPDLIKTFLQEFHNNIDEQNIYEIQNAYENGFANLTERFFKNSPWPEPEVVAPVVHDDQLFLILYKELYYRHIYARVQTGPTIKQRFDSYYNYCSLFNYILDPDGPVSLELPNQWMWDIIDEFIYQFQAFIQYRSKVNKKSQEEIDELQTNTKVWNVHSVLNVLHSLVDKSRINEQLAVYTQGGEPDSVAGEFGCRSLYKMLGYFSLIGLLRLHSLLGDYYQALHVLDNINFNKKNMYSRVPACQVSTYYYIGFAYMMMRRYQDAIRTFSNILLYNQRTRHLMQNRTYLYDQIKKQNDQMYVLLSICLVLHPMRIDESVASTLREKPYSDKMNKMQKGEFSEFEMSFTFACPKFLSPVPPNFDGAGGGFHKEAYQQQLKVFMDEVRQQEQLSVIRSYLKLYTTLPITKLSGFMQKEHGDLHNMLMCFKHKMKNVVWTEGSGGLGGESQSASEVDFFINKEMVHIADTKVARRYGDFFIRQIHKFDELKSTMKMIPMPKTS